MNAAKPLIERYLTYLRVSQEQGRARMRQGVQMVPGGLEANLLFAEAYASAYMHLAETAQKYRLAASGQAMVEALRPRPLFQGELGFTDILAIAKKRREPDPDIETPIIHLPGGPIWVELERPVYTNVGENAIAGLFFASVDHEVEWQLSQPHRPAMRAVFEQMRREPGESAKWNLHFIDTTGHPFSYYEYFEESRAWSIIADPHLCPTGECIVQADPRTPEDTSLRHLWTCTYCNTIMGMWRSWFVTCLLAVQGEFAVSEASTWQVEREQTTRKVRRPGTAKYDEVPVAHDYYLVQFDASMKRSVSLPGDASPETRGSWIAAALEIDPASVIYVRRGFGQSQRELDPDRNPYWRAKRTVEVRAHVRRVPMKVNALQKKITRVVASRYEPSSRDGGREGG
jgi:hypothetical protein